MRRLIPRFWTRDSSVLLGGFLLVIFLIIYVWWPLAEEALAFVDWSGPWWLYIDRLLIGIFLFMSITIVAGADLRRDALIVFVGVFGGLAIEAWGTQTNLWFYYTSERPPMWIIPAWPIASLSIDRLTRFLLVILGKVSLPMGMLENRMDGSRYFLDKLLYWIAFGSFLVLMLAFVAPTFNKPYTLLSFLLCILVTVTPTDYRYALLTFLAGAGLGYFLELWGTTRQCWTYYTYQTPPLFAVLAHGMASVIFWRAGLLVKNILDRLSLRHSRWRDDVNPTC
jgi:hypothetical protein